MLGVLKIIQMSVSKLIILQNFQDDFLHWEFNRQLFPDSVGILIVQKWEKTKLVLFYLNNKNNVFQ